MNERRYWVIVGSRANYEVSRERGFTVQGIKAKHRKKAEQIRPGDRMLYYLTGLMVMAGIITVTSDCYEDQTPIWPCKPEKPELFPWRFKTEPYLIPTDESGFVPVTPIHGQLSYLKKWPEKNWTLGFQGNVHQWPEPDYLLVESLLKQSI